MHNDIQNINHPSKDKGFSESKHKVMFLMVSKLKKGTRLHSSNIWC